MGKYELDSVPTGATVTSDGDEDTLTASGGIKVNFDDKTSLGLVQSYEDVSSDVDDEFTRNATRVSLTRRF